LGMKVLRAAGRRIGFKGDKGRRLGRVSSKKKLRILERARALSKRESTSDSGKLKQEVKREVELSA